MDAVAGLLDGPRARGAFMLRSSMDPPWSLRIRDEAPLTLCAIVRGDAWVVPDEGDPVRLAAGDAAVFRGPDHYTVADDPATPPQVVIHPGQRCTTPDGEDLSAAMSLGVRTWGNSPDGATVMLTGTYQMDGEVSGRLLRALPPLLVMPARGVEQPADPAPGLRGRGGRPGPGGRPRPAARPAADRRAARVVRPPGGRGAGLVPRVRRSGRRARAAADAQRAGAPVERGRARPGERRVAGGAGAALHRARRPAADDGSWPSGASRWPPTCCWSRARPSARSRPGSATAAPSP